MRIQSSRLIAVIGLSCLFQFCGVLPTQAQNQTVGLFLRDPKVADGYVLFTPNASTTTYLIDNYGRLVHSWVGDYKPAISCYLLEDGSLLRTAKVEGKGGGIERLDWDGTVLWHWEYWGTDYVTHHDIEPLPNGNVLMLVRSTHTEAEALAEGRDPALLTSGGLNSESIIEVTPLGTTGGTVVWEWHLWDHFVQDYNAGMANYGVVSDHSELMNINFDDDNRKEWIHSNAIAYNADLDQIVISNRNINEVWVIDHSTSTAEAAGHTGGVRGKGGDFLYRWGNPAAYGGGTAEDRQSFYQHDARWIEPGYPGEGNLTIFNNEHVGPNGFYSSADEIITPVDGSGNYPVPAPGTAFGPETPTWTYVADPVEDFYSSKISGVRRLWNGNTLICEGGNGRFFEVTAGGEMVWEYVCPDSSGVAIPQGAAPKGNRVFRCTRYAPDYPGLQGKDLTPGGPIEIYPITISGTSHTPLNPSEFDQVTVTAEIVDDLAVTVAELWVDVGGGFSPVPMHDDGAHGDGAAGDNVYGAGIPAQPLGTIVSYYVHAEDGDLNSVNDPTAVPVTTYRYTTPGSGLNHTGITLFEQQVNNPELTEDLAPAPGHPWTWTASDFSGFPVAPIIWFEYQDSDHQAATLHWSGIAPADWRSGLNGTFTLTLSNTADARLEYNMHLSLRSFDVDGYAIFDQQVSGGAALSHSGVYGANITVDTYDWGGGSEPSAAELDFDDMGRVTSHDFGEGPWNLDGICRLRLQDGTRPASLLENVGLSLRQLTPMPLNVINDGEAGITSLSVLDDASLWDWSGYDDGLIASELNGPDVTGSATLEISWVAGALLNDETGSGSVTISSSGGSTPASVVAIPTTIEAAGCCADRVGDANGQGGDEPTIGDVSVMIDAKFITGTCVGILECLTEADINQSGGATPGCDDVTIGDISYLIDYLFITGPSLGLPDCL